MRGASITCVFVAVCVNFWCYLDVLGIHISWFSWFFCFSPVVRNFFRDSLTFYCDRFQYSVLHSVVSVLYYVKPSVVMICCRSVPLLCSRGQRLVL